MWRRFNISLVIMSLARRAAGRPALVSSLIDFSWHALVGLAAGAFDLHQVIEQREPLLVPHPRRCLPCPHIGSCVTSDRTWLSVNQVMKSRPHLVLIVVYLRGTSSPFRSHGRSVRARTDTVVVFYRTVVQLRPVNIDRS